MAQQPPAAGRARAPQSPLPLPVGLREEGEFVVIELEQVVRQPMDPAAAGVDIRLVSDAAARASLPRRELVAPAAQSSGLSWPRPIPAAGAEWRAALGLMLDVCAPHGPAKLPAAYVAGARVAWVAGRWWWRPAAGGAAVRHGVAARASSFGSRIGLDSQNFHTRDLSQLLWVGPVPGDIAEIEAYCRIFRAAEQLHTAVMSALCDPETGECPVRYDVESEDLPVLEDKVAAFLGCMLALLNRGRNEVLSGRSAVASAFQGSEDSTSDRIPPLALFRGDMKRCCESMQVALASYLVPSEPRGLDVWRKLQRLKNACFDAGFPRADGYPCPTLFANWFPVYHSTASDDSGTEELEVAFWRGGQVSEEGLAWLLEKGFKTIVDLREEDVKDDLYLSAVQEAVASGKIDVVNMPVEIETAPSAEQVQQFAALVSDSAKKPIYLHSKEGVSRTSAMVSRWKQYVSRSERLAVQNRSLNGNGKFLTNDKTEQHTGSPSSSTNGTKNGTPVESDRTMDNRESCITNGKTANNGASTLVEEKEREVSVVTVDTRASASSSNGNAQVASQKSAEKNGVPYLERNKSDPVDGNMCASATGVVRLQSRRKAEMFLVRTDGFSCTREKVTESSLAFTHPSTQQQMLMWKSPPKTVLLLKKLGDELMEEAKEVASFLHHQEKMNVLVEPDVHDIFARIPGYGFVQTFYTQDTSDLHERVDFVTCLGGDGVILHASNLFRTSVPPVVSFNLGSLGFLTSHNFEGFRQDLRAVIHGNNTLGVYITLRMRLRCEIFRNGKAMPGKVFDVLNEVVVDRGSNPYLSKIECYEHNHLITKVQGDGVIVATPTGSTAYSTAAGGSMVHPNVPCMLFTPICPHSLSFRPVILPDSARLELKIPDDARSNAWVSFDGKRRQQLSRGDSVHISMSQHPLPTVNKSDQTGDWFRSLIRCLNWNERLDQKAL
ncbi:NAD kinase 2, chloroplastic-like [Panicum miliaceum]|uniref:NAD(+) kinase n=1 Tax=Panicum miliaceum TaxID=4540 RepID=A0A3L6PKE8_PANMI|nr:NAD kinase 2, chloroplastic-like [Panicum miliaceum]